MKGKGGMISGKRWKQRSKDSNPCSEVEKNPLNSYSTMCRCKTGACCMYVCSTYITKLLRIPGRSVVYAEKQENEEEKPRLADL